MFRTAKKLATDTLPLLSYAKRIGPVVQQIQGHFDMGLKLIQETPLQMGDALKSFEKASALADDLIDREARAISPEHRTFLAEVYAHHGDTALKDHPYNTGIARESVKKSLALDSKNATAFKLHLRLDSDDDVARELELK